jgi:predicted Zn-dependent protease with MMP-like domain
LLKPTQPNIFSDQQEQWLGDAMADQIERYYKPVQDPAENEYLDHIVKRLLAALPPTNIQFHVVLIDSPSINALSIAGGHIYVFRKLVANAKNEDEVASVIGHEMGHILSHQFGIKTTADFNRLLGVTSVGDKADIYAKFQRLIDASMKDKHPSQSGNSDEKQDEADTVSMYAIAAAGYRPQAFSEFWNRMFFVDGKVGGPLSDFFGTTKPEEKRLREILKLVNALPAGCGATEPSNSPEFQHWQAMVIANQPAPVEADVKPLAEVALTPPLRMDLDRLRFSRDGKYILAQDESSISVLSREPYNKLFRFNAEDALPAEFSPDSTRIIFHTPGLHTEEWSVPDQKLISAHEPLTREPCFLSRISPDGRTLFCLTLRREDLTLTLDLTVLDTATGNTLFQKKGFMDIGVGSAIILDILQRFSPFDSLIPGSLSADGNVLLLGRGENKMAFDLRTQAPVPVGKDLKSSINGPYAFLGNDKVVGDMFNGRSITGPIIWDTAIFSFPDGKKLQNFPFRVNNLESITSENYFLTHHYGEYSVALADVSAAKFIVASKAPSMDVWNGLLLNENPDGSVVLHKIGDKPDADQTATLPISPLSQSIFAVPSDDHRYLAFTTRTRGGVWDLSTGQRVLLARHFEAAIFAADNSLYVEFPKFETEERAIVHFTFAPFSATPVSYKVDETMQLTRGMFQEWTTPSKGKKGTELIVHDVRDNSILWRRTFDEGKPAHDSNLITGESLFAFRLKSDFAKTRLSANPTLASQAAAIKNRDHGGIIQVVDDRTGNILHEMALEAPLDYEGFRGVHVIGDSLYVTGRDNRTIVYSIPTGAQIREFFGYLIAADRGSGRICTANRRGEAVVYDSQGEELAHFNMGSPLRYAVFHNNGDRLILLTADQKVRTMEVASAAAKP